MSETVQYRLLKQLTKEEEKKFDEDFEKLVQEIVGKKVL